MVIPWWEEADLKLGERPESSCHSSQPWGSQRCREEVCSDRGVWQGEEFFAVVVSRKGGRQVRGTDKTSKILAQVWFLTTKTWLVKAESELCSDCLPHNHPAALGVTGRLGVDLNFDLAPPLESGLTMFFIFKALFSSIVLGEHKRNWKWCPELRSALYRQSSLNKKCFTDTKKIHLIISF